MSVYKSLALYGVLQVLGTAVKAKGRRKKRIADTRGVEFDGCYPQRMKVHDEV